jgi:hypothetical protein
VQYYNFELFEVLPYEVNPSSPAGRPEEVVRTQLPIHSEEVIGSQLIYDIGKPALFEGQQYVWRVQAFDPTGQVYYKNNGYSTVCTFTIARPEQDIATEMDFRATAISMTLAEVVWQPEDGKKYVVAHRKTGDPEYRFFTDTVQGPRHIIRSLEHSTTYEVKIAEQTEGKGYGPYSGTVSFRTFDYEAYECQGGPTSFEPPANRQPLPLLLPGDVVHVADFEMVVLQTAGQQGTFSGLGTIYVPWLGTRMAVSFQNIGINTDKQLIRGEVNFVQEVDVESLIFDLPEPAAVDAAIVLKFAVNDASQLSVSIDGDQVTIHGPNNRIVSYTVPSAAEGFTIADNKGNVYLATVQNDGKRVRVDKIGSKDQQGSEWHKDVAERLNHLDADNQITFTNAGTFAFDAYEKWYEGTPHANEFEILGEGYHVPWKFIPKGKSDKVHAELKGDIDPEKVVFKNTTGTVFAAERKGKSFEITLAAASGILGYELYAIWQDGDSTERSLGKLKVTSYPQATHTVKIVPMQEGTIDRDKIQAGLDKIYAPYGISWQVEDEKPFTDRSWDLNGQGLQSSGSGFFSQYTPEMKALNAAYGQARSFDATSVYLFYFAEDEAEENNNLLGDMPLASQVGYIFSKKIDEQAIHTMAHACPP